MKMIVENTIRIPPPWDLRIGDINLNPRIYFTTTRTDMNVPFGAMEAGELQQKSRHCLGRHVIIYW